MDKLCATCGKQLQPEQGFCDNCGAAWAPNVATASNPISAAPLPAVSGTGNKSKSSVIVAIAFVVAAVGMGGWILLRHRTPAGSSVVSTTASSNTIVTSSTPAPPASNGVQAAVVPAPGDTAGVVPPGARPATAAETEAAANSKPCSLVTRAEMEAILGSKIVKVTTYNLTCHYFTDETTSAEVETTWTGGKDAFDQVKGFNSAPGLAEPVAGIGDEAYMQAAGVLHVLKGDTYVVVNSRVYPNELQTESAIARKAMEKLK